MLPERWVLPSTLRLLQLWMLSSPCQSYQLHSRTESRGALTGHLLACAKQTIKLRAKIASSQNTTSGEVSNQSINGYLRTRLDPPLYQSKHDVFGLMTSHLNSGSASDEKRRANTEYLLVSGSLLCQTAIQPPSTSSAMANLAWRPIVISLT